MSHSPATGGGDDRASQPELDFPPPAPLLAGERPLQALDLFAGIGGLSAGFTQAGFSVVGVDSESVAGVVYENARFGRARQANLAEELCLEPVPVVIGGPPCRPWSPVNLQRRRSAHDDHALLGRFVEHVRGIAPEVFVMENVPALGSDEIYRAGMDLLRRDGYDIGSRILHYHHFGAFTRRRRLFTVGIRGVRSGAESFFALLRRHERFGEHAGRPARTVGEAIKWLRAKRPGEIPDHDWSKLRTIGKYREHYETGKFGWTRLQYDRPAPSFGSVAKTYILHPDAGIGDFPERVLSVREVLAIMGFDLSVRFPDGTARARRYQMAANAVSPQVSRAVAQTVRYLLTGEMAPTELDPQPCESAV